MSALARFQALQGLTDRETAELLGLELKEFARQKPSRPSRQTALLCILITVFRPNMELIAATAATSAPGDGYRRPAPSM